MKRNDIKALMRAAMVAELCWNYLRDFCTAVGLRTQIGRKKLVAQLEVLLRKRYELGLFRASRDS